MTLYLCGISFLFGAFVAGSLCEVRIARWRERAEKGQRVVTEKARGAA